MNKILAGIVGLVLVTGVTAGTAKAVFTSNATVEGISITAGNAALLVWDGAAYSPSWNTGLTLTNVYPNYTSPPTTLWLKNNSSSPVTLSTSALLSSYLGDWADLKDKVTLTIDDGTTPVTHTLNDWNTPGYGFGPNLAQGAEKSYTLTFHVDSAAGSEISAKSLTNITFTLTGTQL